MHTRHMAAACIVAAVTFGQCSDALSQPSRSNDRPSPPKVATITHDWEHISSQFGGSKSATRPSRDVTMSFTFPTEVSEIVARGGQSVTKGEVLAKARDGDVISAIELQRQRAENTLEISNAENARDLAEFRFIELKKSGTGSPQEIREREFEFKASQIQLDQAKRNHTEEALRLEQLIANHERYRLEAPFDGVVEEMMIEVGQGVRETDPAVRVVNTERFKLDAYTDTSETMRLALEPGDRAWILLDLPNQPALVMGEVKYVSPAAHASSRWRRVRVELENPSGWPSGMPVCVRFVEPPASFNKYALNDRVTGAPVVAGGE